MQKKVGLIEACVSDQSRALDQVAAYTTYIEGLYRGRGPTIFEISYRHANMVGSPKDFVNASNVVLTQTQKYDLLRTEPLNGDIRTKSEEEGPATREGFWSGFT